MILVHKTFDITADESAEDGEFSENGFIVENEPMTFRELVQALKDDFPQCSTSAPKGSIYEWFSSYPAQDIMSGDWICEHIHYSMDNSPRAIKYWQKAIQYAGYKIKQGAQA